MTAPTDAPPSGVPAALWPSPWPAEDGGPERRAAAGRAGGLGLRSGRSLHAHSRLAIASTMVVLREPGEVYLLGHTGGDDAVSWVEQLHPESLETVRRSPDLPGGPTWPGGLAAHADGSLYVVFGAHAHRLSPELEVMASTTLPRVRPYNSFVVLPDGCLVTKDFAGARPGGSANDTHPDSELVVLRPGTLEVADRLALPEPSVARLSAEADTVIAVCDRTVRRARWDGERLVLDEHFAPVYRTRPGQTYGWDAVVDAGAAWFLDDGEGSERFAGSFVGVGTNTAPLQLVRVDLTTGEVAGAEVCGLPDGLIANPPAIDVERGLAVGYDSSNAVVAAFEFDEPFTSLRPRWRRPLAQAMHPLRFPSTGELLLNDHDAARATDQAVVLDIETGDELGRVDTGGPVQSVLFAAPGWDDDAYVVSFTTVTRLWSQ
ncbi:MAG: hypothetical protein F2534_17940 [Actinobacteria bacterium]|uniref:Unannotated protein n=1 Tax=freshwater metagenome TaxID=449393 RepID=A0A6J6FDA4_9ZZZZ|nr:hypothetical protein [Actinomycetota bacterium]